MVRQSHLHMGAAALLLLAGLFGIKAFGPVAGVLFLGAVVAAVAAKMASVDEQLGG